MVSTASGHVCTHSVIGGVLCDALYSLHVCIRMCVSTLYFCFFSFLLFIYKPCTLYIYHEFNDYLLSGYRHSD